MIYLGNNKISDIYLGNTPISKVYRGGGEPVFEKLSIKRNFTFNTDTDIKEYIDELKELIEANIALGYKPCIVNNEAFDILNFWHSSYTSSSGNYTDIELALNRGNPGILQLTFSILTPNFDYCLNHLHELFRDNLKYYYWNQEYFGKQINIELL